ncbi:MAG: VWA domain-containing protein [Acholeplasmataceae bacterium]|nr:VWA domain-containing protein [Acholeplasmataceae bacterium]
MKKKHIFLLLDTSGSMNLEQIGIVNDMFREIYNELNNMYQEQLISVDTVLFSDEAKHLEEFQYLENGQLTWFDLHQEHFKGKTSLGKAYQLVHQILRLYDYKINDVVLVLITDGLPTDNFVVSLERLDQKRQSKRLTYVLGDKAKSIIQAHVAFDVSAIYKNPHTLIEALKDVIHNG